jgi:large conductance mechanosensitive channel
MVDIPKPAIKAVDFVKEFKEFLLKTNMLALALAVVLGDAAGKVVKVIVSDVLGGIISIVRKDSYGWDALNIPLIRGAVIKLGPLINVLIEFTCVAAVVFIVSKMFIKAATPSPTKACEACKEGIHPDATRCKFCTTEQPKPAAPAAPPV